MANRLMFETGLDGSGFERGLAKLGATGAASLKNFVVGAFGVYSVHQAIAKTVESADELVTASQRLDTTVEQLQVLRQAAKESRLEFGNLEKAFEGFNVARDKALSGGKEGSKMLAAFARLGMTAPMLRTETAPAAFMGQLHQTALTTNAADLDAALKQILPGVKGFGQLIPFLKTDFGALEEKMNRFGMIISTETAAKLKSVKDELGLLGQLLVTGLAPAIVAVIDGLMVGIGHFLHWIDERSGGAKGEPKTAFQGINWGHFGTNVMGIGQGTLGAIDALLGEAFSRKLYERGTDLLAAAELKFQKTGFTGGPLDKMAEALNKSGGGLGDAWDAQMMARKKALDELVRQLKNQVPALLNPTADEKEKAVKTKSPAAGQVEMADALVRTGNFLGSSRGQIESLAQEANRIAREHLIVARQTLSAITRPRRPDSVYPIH